MASLLARSPGDKLDLQLAPEEVGGQPCGTEPLTWGIRCYLQADRVRLDLNCRTPAGAAALLGGGGNHPLPPTHMLAL